MIILQSLTISISYLNLISISLAPAYPNFYTNPSSKFIPTILPIAEPSSSSAAAPSNDPSVIPSILYYQVTLIPMK